MNEAVRQQGKYSQSDEDVIIERFFRGHTGTILELGANDGRHLSNSLAAIERGWNAVLVEPSQTAFEKLSKLHEDNPRVKCYQVAIGDCDCEKDFYESGEHLGTGDTSLISTLVPTEIERWKGSKYDNFSPAKANVLTWQSFYESLEEKTFDVVSCDIEGMDLFVLTQMDLEAMQVKMLIVEYNGKDEQAFTELAHKAGMKLLTKNYENLIFAK